MKGVMKEIRKTIEELDGSTKSVMNPRTPRMYG